MIGLVIICSLIDYLIPATMIVLGFVLLKKPPKKINSIYGYRTTRSMKNRHTWDFAQKTCGKVWIWGGSILVILTLTPFLAALRQELDTVLIISCAVVGAQVVAMLLTLFPVEHALKKNFDAYGRKSEVKL